MNIHIRGIKNEYVFHDQQPHHSIAAAINELESRHFYDNLNDVVFNFEKYFNGGNRGNNFYAHNGNSMTL
jgi:hypothetical protein